VKSAIAAIAALAAGLLVANMLGVATAEAPTGTPVRTVSVQGVATVPISQNENASAATAIYRQGMAGAVADGQSKAEFLAGKIGATLGGVQSVIEGGGYIGCTGGGESGYAEYEGEQPDFGSAPQPGVAAASTPAAARVTHGAKAKHPKRKRVTAKKAAAVACTLTAQVSLVYTIS
jgi:Protein of unknown function (DUF541)